MRWPESVEEEHVDFASVMIIAADFLDDEEDGNTSEGIRGFPSRS